MSDTPSFNIVSNVDTPSRDSDSSDNVLNKLKTLVHTRVERPVVLVDSPARPGLSLRISPNITQAQLRTWRRNAGEDTKAGMDTVKFACQVIAHTTTGFILDGEVVKDDDGYECTFGSQEILEMTGTTRPHPDAVKAIFGIEPHIEATAVAIMEAAGYGDSVDAVDPTMKPSES